ncbi:hypothetical protein MOB34_15445 [Bacillus spizizenii]|nr:hypothetical protein [Bacillus spizizenii]MCY8226967.1 hypothetical protein [Bacillus spizizenii]MCY8891265.1 hypothetical protein [Bacillus spizizenii]MEC0839599.1 hypothetical protein [Bacillus spizizenii]
MLNIINVEFRKMFIRKEFYITLFLLFLISVFIIYQLSSGGGLVNIQQDGNDKMPISEFIIGIVGLFNMLGITAIICCVLVWNIIGSEVDQKILPVYFLNSPSRLKVILSKILVSLLCIVIYNIIFTLTIVISCILFRPEQIATSFHKQDFINIFTASGSFISLSFILILIAFDAAILFGGMGVIFGTIGVFILSSFLNNYGVYENWLPTNITDFNHSFTINNVTVFFVYVVLFLSICIPLVKNREVKT